MKTEYIGLDMVNGIMEISRKEAVKSALCSFSWYILLDAIIQRQKRNSRARSNCCAWKISLRR
eukprot:snap_masked-scaffold_1-processed-gene-29.21-mRNA-1 protein AED:1.00 eAED:1.00 QI:0/0/0/0/1/1/2/0/62